MGKDEEETLRTLSAYRKITDSLIERHHGRFVNSAGDSVLAEFASVVEAVTCAVSIQTALRTENAEVPLERRMEFRIGVNSGDVMVEGREIYGDGVNVAARLESLADPVGICISGTVHSEGNIARVFRYSRRKLRHYCGFMPAEGHRRTDEFRPTGQSSAISLYWRASPFEEKPPSRIKHERKARDLTF